jgi:hypothetical protein
MADAKRNPKKMRKPLMWLRRRVPAADSPKPDSGGECTQREVKPWYRPTLLKARLIRACAFVAPDGGPLP